MTVAKKAKAFFLVFFAILICSGTFIHYFQEKVPEELAAHKKTFKPLVKEAKINSLINLKNKLVKKEITLDEFDKQFENSLIRSNNIEKEYYKKKKVIAKKYSYFNFLSLRRFTFMLMIILLGFISGVYGLYSNLNKDNEVKPILNKVGVLLTSISMFWLFWVFFNSIINQNNLIYLALFIIVSFITTYIVFSLLKKLSLKGLKIKELVNFIFRTRNKHYPEIASKALYAEIHDRALKNSKSVENISNDFEEDMLKTFEKITD